MKLYFEEHNEESCYPLSYFKNKLKSEDLVEIRLFEAKKVDKHETKGWFWCREHGGVGDKGEGTCGKDCEFYAPRNGISGCCKHYSTTFYERTEIELILNRWKNI